MFTEQLKINRTRKRVAKCNIHIDGGKRMNSDIGLTRREEMILRYIASGYSNADIVDQLCISPFTVKKHIRNIFRKIGVPNRLQAIFWVKKNHLLFQG
jgi:DNA-binding CsgD family transcriptional regulator